MRGRVRVLVLIGSICLAALAGCGGDGDETSSLTKAQFIKKAKVICTKGAERKEKALAKAFNSRSPDGLPNEKVQAELILEAVPPIKAMVGELAALEAPEGDEEKVDEVVQSFEEAVRSLETNPSQALAQNYDTFDEASRVAASYGLKVCGSIR